MNTLAELAPQIKQLVDQSQRVLLHCHPSPDPDSYGSALAMSHYLASLGKQATVIGGDSPIPDFVEFLPGGDQVLAKNYLEIDPSQYDLFIILDVSRVDRVTTLGPVVFPATMKTVLIDHHVPGPVFADVVWSDTSYPATAQMVFELLQAWGVTLTREMALCLMLGLYTDTGGFKYQTTKPATFRAAAGLAEIAPDYPQLIFNLENNNRPQAIKFQGAALSAVENFFEERVAISALSYEQIQTLGLSEEDAGPVSIANILKSVRGWEIGIHLFEWQPGVTKLSARTRNAEKFDLTQFTSRLGGGGHKAAAGAHIQKPLALAKADVLVALQQAYPDLH